jgi:hypothetical protein
MSVTANPIEVTEFVGDASPFLTVDGQSLLDQLTVEDHVEIVQNTWRIYPAARQEDMEEIAENRLTVRFSVTPTNYNHVVPEPKKKRPCLIHAETTLYDVSVDGSVPLHVREESQFLLSGLQIDETPVVTFRHKQIERSKLVARRYPLREKTERWIGLLPDIHNRPTLQAGNKKLFQEWEEDLNLIANRKTAIKKINRILARVTDSDDAVSIVSTIRAHLVKEEKSERFPFTSVGGHCACCGGELFFVPPSRCDDPDESEGAGILMSFEKPTEGQTSEVKKLYRERQITLEEFKGRSVRKKRKRSGCISCGKKHGTYPMLDAWTPWNIWKKQRCIDCGHFTYPKIGKRPFSKLRTKFFDLLSAYDPHDNRVQNCLDSQVGGGLSMADLVTGDDGGEVGYQEEINFGGARPSARNKPPDWLGYQKLRRALAFNDPTMVVVYELWPLLRRPRTTLSKDERKRHQQHMQEATETMAAVCRYYFVGLPDEFIADELRIPPDKVRAMRRSFIDIGNTLHSDPMKYPAKLRFQKSVTLPKKEFESWEIKIDSNGRKPMPKTCYWLPEPFNCQRPDKLAGAVCCARK